MSMTIVNTKNMRRSTCLLKYSFPSANTHGFAGLFPSFWSCGAMCSNPFGKIQYLNASIFLEVR